MGKLHYRHVRRRIATHHARLEAALVGELDPNLVGARDHVVVGENHAGLVDHEAGAQTALGFTAGRRLPEPEAFAKVLHHRIFVHHSRNDLGALNGDHRGLDPIHERGNRCAELGRRGRGLG